MIPWLLRNRLVVAPRRSPLSICATRRPDNTYRLKHSKANSVKPTSTVPITREAPSNALGSLVSQYRQSVTPKSPRIQETLDAARPLQAKNAMKDEGKESLAAQKKARIGLKLYETLSAEDLSILYKALNRFDIGQEIQPQERDTVPAVEEMAKNDTQWMIQIQTRHPDVGKGKPNPALGKRLTKVYKFETWTLATEHFWKRMNECFKQQDHHGELNIQYNPATKLTEVQIHINTHTPKALPQTASDLPEPREMQVGETISSGAEASSDAKPKDGAKRKITIGPPALTRKDFILAWSIDIAAFKTRQKQALLDRRAAKRAQRKEAAERLTETEMDELLEEMHQDMEEQQKMERALHLATSASSNMGGIVEHSPSTESSTNTVITSDTASQEPQPMAQAESRTKTKARRSVGSDGLSLQHFLSRTQILAEYRKSVRATKTLPDSHTRRETLDWLRQDLEKLKGETDLHTIKEVLARFRRDSKQFIPSMGLSTISDGEQAGSRLIGRK